MAAADVVVIGIFLGGLWLGMEQKGKGLKGFRGWLLVKNVESLGLWVWVWELSTGDGDEKLNILAKEFAILVLEVDFDKLEMKQLKVMDNKIFQGFTFMYLFFLRLYLFESIFNLKK